MFVVALGFVVTTMVVTHAFGPKRKSQTKLDPFECGIPSQGNARVPFNIKYFLVAILFVLFDVEVIFMYPWAVNFKELGIPGFLEMLVFIALLLIGFFYLKKKGALNWED
jgi:NADH-quinone oxidoreductase subunit A